MTGAVTAPSGNCGMRRWRTYGHTYARAVRWQTPPSPAPPSHVSPSRGVDHRHISSTTVVLRSSKSAKMGRYPQVPSTDAHPLSRRAREAAEAHDEDSGMDVAALCASWRERAGKPGATVILEVEAMLRNAAADASSADTTTPPAHSVTRVDPDASSDTWRLLLTNKNENLYNAFAMETAACAPNSVGLAVGLFAAPSQPPASSLVRMAGLRAVVDPLATGASIDELLHAVNALPVQVPNLPDACGGEPTPVALYHDCVSRLRSTRDRTPSPNVYEQIGDVVKTWTPCGFKHGMYARFKNPNEPSSASGLRDTLRFVVVETSAGYVFGLTTFAPPPMHPRCDWNRKPNNYSAGTRPQIAAAALNAVLAGGLSTMGGDEEGNDTDRPSRTNVIVDPCCGGGTILHAAWSRGYHSIGGDVNAQIVRNAQGNIASFVPAMPAAHATLRGIDEAGRLSTASIDSGKDANRPPLSSSDRSSPGETSGLLATPPRIHEADATSPSTNWVTHAADWLKCDEKGVNVAAVVSNLPFGRNVSVGGKAGGGAGVTADADEYLPLLTALLPIAPRHAFVSGTPIAEAMRECGYENVTQVPVCRFGRIFLTVAMGSEPQWRRGALEPAVNFTLEQATGAKSGKGYVRAPDPDWVEAMGGQSAMNAAAENLRKSTKPPLRVAIDTSYDQDSQRAIRSVAKQLAECIGVKRRAMKVTGSIPGESGGEISPVDVNLTFASWNGTVAEHALDHFNAERWSEVSKDPRDVQDIFMNGECGGDTSTDADTDAMPSKVVYLSPDAEEALEDVEPDTVYIIGGIVDLAARGIAWSLPRANAVGATARRLPIREHLPNVTNQILNIDTAMKVLCEKYSGKEWVDALESALPKRQQGERPARFNRPQKKSIEDLQSAEM